MTSSTIVITGSGLFFLIIMSSLFVPFVSSLGLLRTNNRIEPRNNKRAAIVTPIFPRRSSIVSLDPLFMVEHEERLRFMMESNDVSGSFSLSFSMSPDHAPKMHLNKKTVEVVEKTGVDMFGKTNGFKPTGVSFGTGSYILTGMFLGSIVVVIYVARLVVQRNTTTTSNKSMLQNYSNDPSSSSHIITTGGQ